VTEFVGIAVVANYLIS